MLYANHKCDIYMVFREERYFRKSNILHMDLNDAVDKECSADSD